MGSCISKCCPKSPNSSLKHCNPIVQDKLILVGNNASSTTSVTSNSTLNPTSVSLPLFKKSSVAPYCSPSSSPCTTTFTTSSCSLSSKSPLSSLSSPSFLTSSSLVSIDQFSGFSNEFLWSCARENPHVITVSNDLLVKGSTSSCSTSHASPGKPIGRVPTKRGSNTPLKPNVVAPKAREVLNQSVGSRTPQKRARASSPVLTRQKSLRRESPAEREVSPQQQPAISSISALHRRNVVSLSPTPSRRLRGEAFRGVTKDVLKGPKDGSSHTAEIMTLKRKVMSTNNTNCTFSERNLQQFANTGLLARRADDCGIIRDSSVSKRVETYRHHVNNGVEKRNVAAGVVGARHIEQLEGLSSLLVNDIDNPLISLDCFIFL
ncbi:hypothetical protein Syun_014383 [Stephania yunnanensis]|uniref:Uncharacterized protein n=1 Tax=Stephania yunnanensis TaxID=152371 RepID=A0AAP0P8I7_9MAGN